MKTEMLATDKATLQTIISVHRWTAALFSFKTTKPPGYQFMAGQYARLGLAANGGMLWRAYSITSAPADDYLEYYCVSVPSGAFTTQLADLKPGDSIWTERQSYGFMTADRFSDGDELWMLSTGTGVGPFVSILRDPMVWKRFRHLVLVHGVRHAQEFAYQDELLALQQAPFEGQARLQLIQCVTREREKPPGRLTGRITSLLESGELEEKAGLPISAQSSRLMLCGNPEMIEDTRRLLHHRGLRPCRRTLPGQFVTENYW